MLMLFKGYNLIDIGSYVMMTVRRMNNISLVIVLGGAH